jgi:hypothetical protein
MSLLTEFRDKSSLGKPVVRSLTDKTLNLCFTVAMITPIGQQSFDYGWYLGYLVAHLPLRCGSLVQELVCCKYKFAFNFFRTAVSVLTKSEYGNLTK